MIGVGIMAQGKTQWLGWLMVGSLLATPIPAVWAQTVPSGQSGPSSAAQQPVEVLESAEQITQRLLAANQLPSNVVQSVQVVRSNQLNAATDGRRILISSALWNQLRTNDERAFIISHELAHVILQHIEQTQARRIGISLLDRYLINRFLEPGSWWDVAQNLGFTLIDKRFSRNVEYEADDLGLQLMARAGYRPQAALQVFDMFQRMQSYQLPEFLLDHPLNRSRIEALVRRYPVSG
jgi:predicted Zn-dependent protease